MVIDPSLIEDGRRIGKLFKGLADTMDALEKLNSLDQAILERQSQLEVLDKKKDEATQALNSLANDYANTDEKVQDLLGKAKDQRIKVLKEATDQAKAILDKAQMKADELADGAAFEYNKIIDDTIVARKKYEEVVKLRSDEERRLVSVQAALAKLKEQI